MERKEGGREGRQVGVKEGGMGVLHEKKEGRKWKCTEMEGREGNGERKRGM